MKTRHKNASLSLIVPATMWEMLVPVNDADLEDIRLEKSWWLPSWWCSAHGLCCFSMWLVAASKESPEGTPTASLEWLRLQFWSKNKHTKFVSLQYVGEFQVKYVVQQRQWRKTYEDTHYTAALFRYTHGYCVTLRDYSLFVYLDVWSSMLLLPPVLLASPNAIHCNPKLRIAIILLTGLRQEWQGAVSPASCA